MNQNGKYALIPSVALADDLADYLIEVSEKIIFIIIDLNRISIHSLNFIFLSRQYSTHLLGQRSQT